MPRLVIQKGEGVGRDHVLGGGECVVGRDASATFVLDDRLASRRHFRVFQESGAYWVQDLGSTNGTLLNGKRVERDRLSDGDRIRAGGTEVAFVQKDLLSGAAARPGRAREAQEPRPAPTPSTEAPVRRRRRR